jgi:hypothetical protein
MTSLEVDGAIMATSQVYRPISTDKAIVELDPGCVWSYVTLDGRRVGIVFAGSARFVVDAIAETRAGAVGKSESGALKGAQLLFYQPDIESLSHSAQDEDLRRAGYGDQSEFRSDAESVVGRHDQKSGNFEPEGKILLGKDESETKIVLVLKDEELVLTYGKRVYVVSDDRMVSVGGDGVSVTNSDGRNLLVTKDGIQGLEELENLGERIGTQVARAVRRSMKKTDRYASKSSEDDDFYEWD